MAIVTPQLIKNLFVAFKKHFKDGLKAADSDYQKIATVIPSSTASNIYAVLGMFPKLRKWVNSRIIKSMKINGYAITNDLHEATVSVPRISVEDDSVGIYNAIFEEAGRAAQTYPDEIIFPLLQDGENQLCYDGNNYFDEEHPVAAEVDGSGKITGVSNLLKPKTGETAVEPWYVMVTKRSLKPMIWQERVKPDITAKTNDETSDHVFMEDEYLYGIRARGGAGFGYWQMCVKSTAPLTAANFEKACAMIANYKADGLRPIGLKADLLVVPQSLEAAAEDIVKADRLENGKYNRNYKKTELLVTPWLVN